MARLCNSCCSDTNRSWKPALVHSEIGFTMEKSYQSGTKRFRKSELVAISLPRNGVVTNARTNDPTIHGDSDLLVWEFEQRQRRNSSFVASHSVSCVYMTYQWPIEFRVLDLVWKTDVWILEWLQWAVDWYNRPSFFHWHQIASLRVQRRKGLASTRSSGVPFYYFLYTWWWFCIYYRFKERKDLLLYCL